MSTRGPLQALRPTRVLRVHKHGTVCNYKCIICIVKVTCNRCFGIRGRAIIALYKSAINTGTVGLQSGKPFRHDSTDARNWPIKQKWTAISKLHSTVFCILYSTTKLHFTVFVVVIYVFGAVDKTSSSFSAHGKIGNFIIIIIILVLLVITSRNCMSELNMWDSISGGGFTSRKPCTAANVTSQCHEL